MDGMRRQINDYYSCRIKIQVIRKRKGRLTIKERKKVLKNRRKAEIPKILFALCVIVQALMYMQEPSCPYHKGY